VGGMNPLMPRWHAYNSGAAYAYAWRPRVR
jgi:hypothetical protein